MGSVRSRRATEPPVAAPAARLRDLRVALTPWLVARVLVAAALLGAWRIFGGLAATGGAPGASGLWVWDAGWYRALAQDGYVADEAIRFFPLLPLLGRLAGGVLGTGPGIGLLVVTWAAALAYGVLLVRLVRVEGGGEGAARRAAWLAMLAPGASVLVLAYSEPLAGALAVGFFLAVRTGRPGLAVPLGLLAGLTRPTGLLLALPAVIEAVRARPRAAGERARWLAAVLSPAASTVAFCLWAWGRYGDPMTPYTAQRHLRGGLAADPRGHLFASVERGLDWRLQLLLLAGALALLVVAARRLPASYPAWAACSLAAAVTTGSGHSLPRYLAANFPLLIAAALVSSGRRWAPVLLGCCAVFLYVAVRGFSAGYVL